MSKELIALNDPREDVTETLKAVLTLTLPHIPDAEKKAHAITCARAISRGFLELHIQATPSTREAD
ncbi:hypothetical protein QN399_01075 [Pseudomonas sp. 10C3]|uniref:hypothetical protein n=1 Tax=Pseudomonas sp. 10C3 TaxID=3118753 RepID=UPI002E81AF3A|nr:hypothetical protein [Pseudomonas sp. 10C3]MEE3504868.1 hypothetical protein [Pseudomonas sp. 10C3]